MTGNLYRKTRTNYSPFCRTKMTWFKHIFKKAPSESYEETSDFIWCLVGNAVEEREYGEEKEIKSGTKHFRPGAKLYCFPPLWGDGYEKIKVIGLPRKSKRRITVVMKSDLINNWRKQKVYDQFIIDTMIENRGWDYSADSHKRLDELLDSLIKYRTNIDTN